MGLVDMHEVVSLAQKYAQISIDISLLDTTEEGMLQEKIVDNRYLLLPRDEEFLEIRYFFKNIFNT